eukprot:scaffold15661_cov134-Isochrysis_galbana.AAC.3
MATSSSSSSTADMISLLEISWDVSCGTAFLARLVRARAYSKPPPKAQQQPTTACSAEGERTG